MESGQLHHAIYYVGSISMRATEAKIDRGTRKLATFVEHRT